MKKIKLLFIFCLFTLLANTDLVAQPGAPDEPGCWPPPCVPIDGGIVALIIAGAAYGTKKIYDLKK